jgi:hypothetical protein
MSNLDYVASLADQTSELWGMQETLRFQLEQLRSDAVGMPTQTSALSSLLEYAERHPEWEQWLNQLYTLSKMIIIALYRQGYSHGNAARFVPGVEPTVQIE